MGPEELKLEELKIVSEQKRFFVSKYLQAATFYFAISGLALNILIGLDNKFLLVLISIFSTSINIMVYYLAGKFRDLVYHYLDRERVLCNDLGFSEPFELKWGYWFGILLVTVILLSFVILCLIKYFDIINGASA